MKKKIAIITIMAAFCLPFLAVTNDATVYAVDVLTPVCNNPDPDKVPDVCQDSAAGSSDNPIFGPNGIITRIISVLARVVGVIAVIAIIIYGLKFVSASGDPANAKTARQAVVYAIIGLVVALVAQGIVTFVLNKL